MVTQNPNRTINTKHPCRCSKNNDYGTYLVNVAHIKSAGNVAGRERV